MGVFKWLRRERMTVTTHHDVGPTHSAPNEQCNESSTRIKTIRTEEYKRDLAEFQARRSAGPSELRETPARKKCGRHSLPVSCTDCATDHDNTFSYEKKSALKYKQSKRRGRSTTPENERVPNIQFLFQNQVFMPGNVFAAPPYSEPRKRQSRRKEQSPDMDFLVQKHIDFKDDEQAISPPDFYKNSALPFDVKNFLSPRREGDAVDGSKCDGDVKSHSQNSDSPCKDDSGDDKLWEVMSELKHFDRWADEQLDSRTPNLSKSDDSKSETSTYGMPVASASDLDVTTDGKETWHLGKWGVVPVQIKKLAGVTTEHVRKKRNVEINILRKCRHPNIILLMGIYAGIHDSVNIICERCVDSLFGIIHEQGRILSAQTAVHYALDIANALAFLRMQGYVHTGLTSLAIMVTGRDAAKLADFSPCVKINKGQSIEKEYDLYTPEPDYVNIEDTRQSITADREPLLSENPSEVYIASNSVPKPYKEYLHSQTYAWQAPELFVPGEDELVYPCSKSDVYSLCLVLWECCNAKIPFKNLSYDKLKEQYTLWKTGISLPQDGTYPGCLLSLLQHGLKIQRKERMDLDMLQNNLQTVKNDLDDLGYVIIPARLPNKKISFNTTHWDTTTPTDSDCLSPQNTEHKVIVHKIRDSSTESEKDCSKSGSSPLYETVLKSKVDSVYGVPEKCFVSANDTIDHQPILKYELLPEKECSSACSTPIAKIKARIKEMETPGSFHRSDSTEYCSILSPNRTNLDFNDDSNKEGSCEHAAAKLSRSFTPKSYRPLHIKVPECNLDSIKPFLKERDGNEKTYNFNIKNYSLPTTPIARSNKLRKNAWLSGDLSFSERRSSKAGSSNSNSPEKDKECFNQQSVQNTSGVSTDSAIDKATKSKNSSSPQQNFVVEESSKSVEPVRDTYTGLRRVDPPHDFVSSETNETTRERANSWTLRTNATDQPNTKYIEEEVLANVNVKPLVAIHEKWIYEANRKTGRSMSLPENNRNNVKAVKPASHCLDTMQNSLPQLNIKKPNGKPFRNHTPSPNSGRTMGFQWEQYCQARDTIAKNMDFRDSERGPLTKIDFDKRTPIEEKKIEPKIDQATDTKNVEEFIRDVIRKEFQNLIQEVSDDASTVSSSIHKNEELLNKGVANIMESLNSNEDVEKSTKREPVKSFSRLKINGNNKPLLQITFSRSGENSIHVLDKNCVNVTICDSNSARDKLNVSVEDTLTGEEAFVNSLKRCQAFSAIQEAKSTEDLYIDDDLSTHMQENFGGKVKLIPLHGSLHEILCEREEECCLLKVKQENGCDTIYFRCDNSDGSTDAIDGPGAQDTVVFKRSISLIEERIQRILPKEKRAPAREREAVKMRPKSEVFIPIRRETRAMSHSSPSLATQSDKEVELNIENVMCYQDSSSDECLKCQVDNDDFEMMERKIEEDLANNLSSLNCGCLEKISEENLLSLNGDDDIYKD